MFKNCIKKYGIDLNRMQLADGTKVLAWRNSESVRSMMISDRVIGHVEHFEWLSRIINAGDEAQFIASYRGQEFGVVNFRLFSCRNNQLDNAEPGIYIANDDFKGSLFSFGPMLCVNDYLFEELDVSSLYARVLLKNNNAIRFNEALGYQQISKQVALDETGWQDDGRLLYLKLTQNNYLERTAKLRKMLSR
jgi:RimJ/RimL family protein N-acetyltransferase